MKIVQIASGSKGNSTYIESGDTRIIIDCGISKKRIVDVLSQYNYNLDSIDAILITHEHTDHVSGLLPLYRATNAIIYMTLGTFNGLNQNVKDSLDMSRVKFIKHDSRFIVKDIDVETIQTFHDAIDSVGFILKDNLNKLVYITDTGYIHESFLDKLSNADMYILESNHDPAVLMESNRPYQTKLRILSDHGHLSNEDSAYIASKLIGEKTRYILLAHISEECNVPELAIKTYENVFESQGVSLGDIKLICLSQIPLKEIKL